MRIATKPYLALVSLGERLPSLYTFVFWLMVFLILPGTSVQAIILPSGFQETIVFSGLTSPTVVRFAPDGRVIVAEKIGRIKVFNGLSDTTADLFADLSTNVFAHWDRGLLGMAIDPDFPTRPYVYVLYAYDFDPFFIGPQPPRWNDTCPTPPGDTADGCVVSGRISKLEIAPNNTLVGVEQVLLENNYWCQQYPSHSIGTLEFGPEGALYASAGDGASFTFNDWGQMGIPKNPCDDPPLPRGQTLSPPTAEGGALRSQDIRTLSDHLSYDGTVIRINPDTGAAWPTNPLIGGDTKDDRIIAYGLRNPFRMRVRPNSNEVWIGDVGWNVWEEINRIANVDDSVVENFGWPCYEGTPRQGGYDSANLNLCESLYVQNNVTAPYYAYNHSAVITPTGDACPTGGSSIAGMAFYGAGVYPSQYQDALFFADYSRGCIYVMQKGANGHPDPATRAAFGTAASGPVHLEIGPGGDLYYADLGGKIRRIAFSTTNLPPQAVAQATPTAGLEPLIVQFDASASTDPNPGATLFYHWDLDADGQYDDSTVVDPVFTYTSPGSYQVGLQVTDDDGASDTDQITISVGNTAPTATILSPSPSLTWRVGQEIVYSGEGNDPEQGVLPATAMHWEIILHHCPGGSPLCHEHTIEEHDDITGGTFVAPDHEWDAYLEFRLTVTDGGGLDDETSSSIDPQTVLLTFNTNPSGLNVTVGGLEETTPFVRPAIIGSLNSISGTTPQFSGSNQYCWVSWSDGGAQTHEVLAGETGATYTASYTICQVTGLTFNPASVAGGSSSTGTVTVSAAAPFGGYNIALSSNVPEVQVPPSVTVQQGNTSANFVATTSPVVSQVTATISANLNGTVTSQLTVLPNVPPSVSITAPANNSCFIPPATIQIDVNASDSDGTVSYVEFYANGNLLGTDNSSPYGHAWINPLVGNYNLTAKAVDNLGVGTISLPVSVSISSLPAQWTHQDVGAVGVAGSVCLANGVYTIKASGTAIDNRTDAFHFVYKPLSGSGEIIARVSSLQNTHAQATAGVMIRQNLGANSAFALMMITPQLGPRLKFRTAQNAIGGVLLGGSGVPPYWLKVVRAGDVFNGYKSTNGVSWVLVGSVTISMTTDAYVGLAYTSRNNAVLGTATMDSVQVTTATGNQSPSVTISSPANGSVFTAPASITINASASDSDGTINHVDFYSGSTFLGTDSSFPYSFNYNNVPTGPYTFTAVATDDDQATTTSTPVNVTVNASNTSPTVNITSPANGAVYPPSSTILINATASDVDGTVSQVAFYANGNLLDTDTSSPYSTNWTNVQAGSYNLTAVATDNLGAPTTSAPVNVTVNSGGGSLPPPWQNIDVGAVGVPGSASYSSGVFNVAASGTDIDNRTDAFRFVYQPLSGNGEIIARVSSLQNTHAQAKAGVMIRQNLGANSAFALMHITPQLGPRFKYRTAQNAIAGGIVSGNDVAPYWFKVVRAGDVFSGYKSVNGVSWVLIGSVTISMPSNVYIGLAHTSHNNAVLGTASFDNVTVADTP